MKLETIEIKNYRSIFHDYDQGGSFVLQLGEGVNAITGPNNVGKSNVLRALAFALDPDFTFHRGRDMPALWSNSKPSVTLTFRVPETKRPAREQRLIDHLEAYERKLNPDLRSTSASKGIVRLRTTMEGATDSTGTRRCVFVVSGVGARSLRDDDELLLRALDQFHRCFHFVMISSGESLESLMEGKFRDMLQNVLRDNLKKAYRDAEARRSSYLADLQEGLLPQLTARIDEELKDLFPEIAGVTLEPDVLSLDETMSRMRVRVSDVAATDLADKGTGVRGGLIIAMLNHFADVGKRSMLFAVEEPESFLHPAAQEQLREDLEALSARPDVSLLVTTHSPYIVSRQQRAKVFALGKDVEGRTVLENEAGGTDPQAAVLGGLFRDRLFVEWLDRASSMPVETRLVLVVEGYTDEAFARLALTRAGRDELLEGVAFLQASAGQASGGGGASLAVMQALLARALAGEDTTVAALFDNDEPGRKAAQTLKEVGEKTKDWKRKRTLFSYCDIFNNQTFEYEAEDLWPASLHESFKDACGEPQWLRREAWFPKGDEGKQFSWSAEAKSALMDHLRAEVTADHCGRWVSLFEYIRSQTGIDDRALASNDGAPEGPSAAFTASSQAGVPSPPGPVAEEAADDEESEPQEHSAATALKKQFLGGVLAAISESLLEAGVGRLRMHAHGAYIHATLPEECGLSAGNGHLIIKVTTDDARVELVIAGFPSREDNARALAAVQEHYGPKIDAQLAAPVDRWAPSVRGGRRSYAQSFLPGGGYQTGSVEDTAAWVAAQCSSWVALLATDPVEGLGETVAPELLR